MIVLISTGGEKDSIIFARYLNLAARCIYLFRQEQIKESNSMLIACSLCPSLSKPYFLTLIHFTFTSY